MTLPPSVSRDPDHWDRRFGSDQVHLWSQPPHQRLGVPPRSGYSGVPVAALGPCTTTTPAPAVPLTSVATHGLPLSKQFGYASRGTRKGGPEGGPQVRTRQEPVDVNRPQGGPEGGPEGGPRQESVDVSRPQGGFEGGLEGGPEGGPQVTKQSGRTLDGDS